MAYKKNVDDMREAPALKIIHLLEARRAHVEYHDAWVPVIPMTREHPDYAGRTSVPLNADTLGSFDAAVIVTNPEVSSVRDSDRIIGMLDSKTRRAEAGEKLEKHLLLTRYDPARAARGEMMKVEDVLEILAIPLLGVVAESPDVLTASNLGRPVPLYDPGSAAAVAYVEAARRLMGEDVPVAAPVQRQSLIRRLFGRKAAAA